MAKIPKKKAERTERLDMRLTKREKAALGAHAKKLGVTSTDIVAEFINKFIIAKLVK